MKDNTVSTSILPFAEEMAIRDSPAFALGFKEGKMVGRLQANRDSFLNGAKSKEKETTELKAALDREREEHANTNARLTEIIDMMERKDDGRN